MKRGSAQIYGEAEERASSSWSTPRSVRVSVSCVMICLMWHATPSDASIYPPSRSVIKNSTEGSSNTGICGMKLSIFIISTVSTISQNQFKKLLVTFLRDLFIKFIEILRIPDLYVVTHSDEY